MPTSSSPRAPRRPRAQSVAPRRSAPTERGSAPRVLHAAGTHPLEHTPRWISAAETARLLRAALARAFPGVKVSVRTLRGVRLSIRYVDGPAALEVESLAGGYAGRSFDAGIDLSCPRYHWLLPGGSAAFAYTAGTAGSMGWIPGEEHPAPADGAELVRFAVVSFTVTREYTRGFLEEVAREVARECDLPPVAIRETPSGALPVDDGVRPGWGEWTLGELTLRAARVRGAGLAHAGEEAEPHPPAPPAADDAPGADEPPPVPSPPAFPGTAAPEGAEEAAAPLEPLLAVPAISRSRPARPTFKEAALRTAQERFARDPRRRPVRAEIVDELIALLHSSGPSRSLVSSTYDYFRKGMSEAQAGVQLRLLRSAVRQAGRRAAT